MKVKSNHSENIKEDKQKRDNKMLSLLFLED